IAAGMKLLGIAHGVVGVASLALALWLALAPFRVLPNMSTGTIGTNLPFAAMLALTFSAAPALLGFWMLTLGRAALRGDAVRGRLGRTHGLLLVPALAAASVGVLDLQAAERSAAHGGGLLGAIGLVPLVLGGCLAIFNAAALAAAWRLDP